MEKLEKVSCDWNHATMQGAVPTILPIAVEAKRMPQIEWHVRQMPAHVGEGHVLYAPFFLPIADEELGNTKRCALQKA